MRTRKYGTSSSGVLHRVLQDDSGTFPSLGHGVLFVESASSPNVILSSPKDSQSIILTYMFH